MVGEAESVRIRVRFPNADAVFLMGDFNNWSTTATPTACLAQDIWEVALPKDKDLGRHGFFVFERAHPVGRYRPAPSPQASE